MAAHPRPDSPQKMTPTPAHQRRRFSPWTLLLVLPYFGLCFPALYARATPALLGFPFFYWYQFAWVILASGIMGVVYFRSKS